ncbi:flavodoxin [Uliginosibacterium sp. H1]|uniref:flavodoxin n=1 Tax=Uliginosibacterium sp. H1 TaxID=3114757 RepID=UPI002E17DA51|nr:flavodoxin [Uliginosibacterium sp. H1]
MQPDHDAQRRLLMTALAALPLGATRAASATERQADVAQGSRMLVAFFSRSGNTRVIAGFLQRTLGTDLHEIVPATAYPADYETTVAQATRERNSGYAPALAGRAARMADYDTVFLGFPVWGMSLPPVIRSFLRTHDLARKNLVPVITHGGYGSGDSLDLLARQAPQARMGKPFILQCDQERSTNERIDQWLKDTGMRR